MVPTHVTPYRDGELRTGWASWDDGSYESRSIKYAYRDASGKISRGCPELPFDVLVDMVVHAYEQGELSTEEIERLRRMVDAAGGREITQREREAATSHGRTAGISSPPSSSRNCNASRLMPGAAEPSSI